MISSKACSLVKSQLAIVDGGEGEGRDVRPRGLAGDYIVFSADVMHVCGKLAEKEKSCVWHEECLAALVKAKVRGL